MSENTPSTIHAVTGAFGFSGKYIARRLLDAGRTVVTLTNSPDRPNPFKGQVQAVPFNFGNPKALAESLKGVQVLYNTYWVRFNHKGFNHREAVRNTQALFEAAKTAGVKRVVHVSITNPDLAPGLEYFNGKWELENDLKHSGLSYAIVRPAVLFGPGDILINNIAWAVRRLPVLPIFGTGKYHIQPVYVDDLAALMVDLGGRTDNVTVNALGPEVYRYRDLVETMARVLGKKRLLVNVPPCVGYCLAGIIGALLDDKFVTREEIDGLTADLLHVAGAEPTGQTLLSAWLEKEKETIGLKYASELDRRADRTLEY